MPSPANCHQEAGEADEEGAVKRKTERRSPITANRINTNTVDLGCMTKPP
jgi:hypothetical protein